MSRSPVNVSSLLQAFGLNSASKIDTNSMSRFSFDSEPRFLALKYGLMVDEFHVSEHKEHSYKKEKEQLIMSLSMFRELIRIRWRNLIGRYN